jgi:hypothetical protein
MSEVKLSKKDIINELWMRGELSYKFHSVQKEMYRILENSEPNSTLVWLCSRQIGKSFMIALIATIYSLREKDSIVKILTDTKLHCRTIYEPLFKQILDDCPENLKPTYIPSQYLYVFPNGSQIQLAGTDGNSAERLRGQTSVLVLVDEAGFCNRLNYNVMSILAPTTTHTGGKIVLASSAPEDPDHDFVTFIEKAEMEGKITNKTIYDNPLLTGEQINGIIARYPLGINDPNFRREYLNIIEKNEETTVFPEITADNIHELSENIPPKPAHYFPYVGMDLGFKDLTVILFGYHDFKNDLIVIEKEIVKTGKDLNLRTIGYEILEVEDKLWTDPLTGEKKTIIKRVSDINYLVTEEITKSSDYQITFMNADKSGQKGIAVNTFRAAINSGRIKIHAEQCPILLRHLKNVKWKKNSNKTEFDRSPDDGHYDAVDACLYLFRAIDPSRNPYPKGVLENSNTHYATKDYSKNKNVYKILLGKK